MRERLTADGGLHAAEAGTGDHVAGQVAVAVHQESGNVLIWVVGDTKPGWDGEEFCLAVGCSELVEQGSEVLG